MSNNEMKDLEVQEKKELKAGAKEQTRQGVFFEPAVDIYETQAALTLLADVPGATAENLEIDIRDNLLTLTARAMKPDPRWKPLHEEYRLGDYSRQFRLGHQIDQAKISARIKDGVLTLHLPKAEALLPRKIQVQTLS